jgi:hypothetical protein
MAQLREQSLFTGEALPTRSRGCGARSTG